MKSGTFPKRFLASILLIGLCTSVHAAESPDERFVAGLRERGLFELAVMHCRQELAAPGLPAGRRAALTIELARTYAEQAVQAPADDRESLWKQALEVTAEFQAAHADSPRLVLVQLQGALVLMARGESERQEATKLADGGEALKAAKAHLRQAIGQFEVIRRTVDERVRRAPRQTAARGNELTSVELEALAKNIAFQLARAARSQAECYSANSPDRANSLTLALEWLEPLAELAVVDDLVWRSRIEQAVCYRLLNDPAQAAAAIERILKNDPPPEVAARARAEAQLAGSGSERAAPEESGPGRIAAQLYRGGKLDQALEAYDRAARQTREQGQVGPAFALELAAAAIEQERGQHDAARDRYRSLALANATEPRAGAAHLQAVFAAAALAREAGESDQAARLDAYAQLLTEHLAQWPQSATADRARLMLGELRSAQHRWSDAVAVFQDVDPAGTDFQTAMRMSFAAHQQWLAELPTADEKAAELAERAVRFFEQAAELAQGDDSRVATVFAARLRLGRSKENNISAARLLARALAASDDAPQSWQFEARALLVMALAGGNRLSEASIELEQLASAPSERLVELVGELARLSERADPAGRHELGGLTLRGITLLDALGENLPEESQAVIDRARVSALDAAGRHRDAVRALDELAKREPLDGDRCEMRARLLAETGDPKSLTRSLTEWRAIEGECRPGSPRWFRSRWGQADVLRRQANPDEAIRLIRLTAVLHPDMGGGEMKARFDQLRLACEQAM